MIEIIGAPFDVCGKRLGSRLGPIAMRLEGLVDGLRRLGHDVTDTGAVFDLDAWVPKSDSDRYARANEAYREITNRVAGAHRNGGVPFVIGGDHSISIGSIAGALRKYGDGLAVLWVDAHMDLNTPDTSPSGNLHGMSLAALTGLKPQSGTALDEEWMFLLEEIVGEPFLSPQNIAWLCLRDVDEGEVANSKRIPGCLPLTMQDVDQDRIVGCLQKIFDHFQKGGAKALWVSFDVDSLDPLFAPGTGTAVRGGLTYREGHLIAETLHEFFEGSSVKLAGLDIVEVNPLVDRNNETANVAMEWALSFFGKTILHPMDPGRTER